MTALQNACTGLKYIAERVHETQVANGFHDDVAPGRDLLSDPNKFPRCCALIGTEISEALEAHRCKEGPQRIAEELADAVIRICDTAHVMGLDIGEAVYEKHKKNEGRPHMHGGKLY